MNRIAAAALIALAMLSSAVAAADTNLDIRSLKLLVPIYRGAAGDAEYLDDAALATVINGCELGRLFYYRNTFGKLNLAVKYLPIDTAAPDNNGPTYDNIEADLRARGIRDNQYDGVFTTGVGLAGNWGGFRILGRTGAAFGGADIRGDLGWYPDTRDDIRYGGAWNFVHEFQHALDSPIASGAGHPEFLSGHPYSDSMEGHFTWGHRGAQHWDWEAHTLRAFIDYMDVPGVTDTVLVVTDTDGDGLPDEDPRLPMDEKRLGSDPRKVDTDGDGLEDLAEFSADIYRGSDPRVADTDGDGVVDGEDRNPTVALAESIPYTSAAAKIDGEKSGPGEPYGMLASTPYVTNSTELATSKLWACWNEDALFVLAETQARPTLEMMIDTSAENGFWEGGDTYLVRVDPEGKVTFGGLGLQGDVPGATAAWGKDGLEVKLPAMIGHGVNHVINWGGKPRPQDLTDGMVLLGGRMISLNLALVDGDSRVLYTPNWSMFDIRLAKSASDPARPSLRFTRKATRLAQPVVNVTGARPQDRVVIIDADGKTLGERPGDGDVILTGALKSGPDAASGANKIRAKAGTALSNQITLVVDTSARAPGATVAAGGASCAVSGEPGAVVELYAGVGTSPVWPVGGITLDEKGQGTLPLPTGRGFLGEYGLGTAFGAPQFARVDEQIKYDYNADTADPRLPGDGFCIRWTGWLDVAVPGEYTFYLTTDDGSRMWIDGAQVIDNWGHHAPVEKSATVKLDRGEHQLRVDYYEEYGWASAHLEYAGPSMPRTHDIPVRPLSQAIGKPVFFVRQTDAVGNVSVFKRL